MNSQYQVFALLLAALWLVGCQPLQSELQSISAAHYQRGLIKLSGNKALYRSCERAEWRVLNTEKSTLETEYRRITAQRDGLAVYFEGLLSPDEQLDELLMLGGDLATCSHTLDGIQLRAGGLEPVWFADISDTAVVINNSSALKIWRLSPDSLERHGIVWRWQGRMEGLGNPKLKLWPQVCRDALGAWYRLSAEFTAGALSLKGCARYGDLVAMSLAQSYYSKDAALLRQVGLALRDQGRAELSLIDRMGGSERYVGQWRLISQRRLLVSLQDLTGQISDQILLFDLVAGNLQLAAPSALLGESLRLLPGPLTQFDRLRSAGNLP